MQWLNDAMAKLGMEKSPDPLSWYNREKQIVVTITGETGERYAAHIKEW
jgi:hypothetical protein